MTTANAKARRGTTLIEAVVVVLVLAIAVPPTISGMMGSAARREDAIQITRATTLAASVLEQIMCDAVTADIGADPSAYLDTAVNGLRDRVAATTSLYTDLGMTYSVTVGPEVSSSLVTTGHAAQDVYREVVVSVTFVDASGTTRTIPVTTMISKP